MELVLKTCGEKSFGGANPSRSAILEFGRVFGIGNEPSSKDGGGNPIGVQVAALPPSLESCAELVMHRIGSATPQGISRSSRLLSAILGCWASGLRRRTVDPVFHGFESRTPRHLKDSYGGIAQLAAGNGFKPRIVWVRVPLPLPIIFALRNGQG